jgi:hypothetical protein
MNTYGFQFKNRTGPLAGIIAREYYQNGYGVNIVQNPLSLGSEDGFFELVVLRNGRFCFDTPIADNYIEVTLDEARQIAEQVKSFRPPTKKKWGRSFEKV